MKKLLLPLSLALVVFATAAGVSAGRTLSRDAGSSACKVKFEATIHRGPDAGLSVSGTLTIRVSASGSLSGTLPQKTGVPIRAFGQVQGRAISFVLELGGGRDVFGVGAARNAVSSCRGAIGGSLTGPRPGDGGDWGYGLGG